MPGSEQDEEFMAQALGLARRGEQEGEVPVGAVLARDGEIIGRGWNRTIGLNDPSAHAEMIALREAGAATGNYRLPACTLYVTLEPCCMCAGAIIQARLERVVFGAFDPKTGAAGSVFDLLPNDKHHHRLTVEGGCCQEQCGELLRAFFRARRA